MARREGPLKDRLINREKIELIADQISQVHPAFRRDRFVDLVQARLGELELTQRITWISHCLETFLPPDYRRAVTVLLDSLPAPCDPGLSDGDFGDFIYAPHSEFVARRGCTTADLAFSLSALKQMTTRFSAEFAIRPFLAAHPDHTLHTLGEWTRDEHYHVRRLCSEGTRPRLPWGRRLAIPVAAGMPILDRLFADRTRFVTRSVANHLNDIAKSDPDLVVATLRRWRDSGRQTPGEMDLIVRHATRHQVRSGHADTLTLLGIDERLPVAVTRVDVPARVDLDMPLEFSLTLLAERDADLLVDYVLHFAGPSGQPSSRKVYTLGRITLRGGVPVTLTKRHMMRSTMSTRRLHLGEHSIEFLLNGTAQARRAFWLGGSARA